MRAPDESLVRGGTDLLTSVTSRVGERERSDPESLGYRLRHPVLKREDLVHLTVVTLSPERPTRGRGLQLSGDAHCVGGALQGSTYHSVDAMASGELRPRDAGLIALQANDAEGVGSAIFFGRRRFGPASRPVDR
jgi:hypothetical protein